MPHVFSVREANGPLTSVERQVSGHARVLARDKAQQPSFAFSRELSGREVRRPALALRPDAGASAGACCVYKAKLS